MYNFLLVLLTFWEQYHPIYHCSSTQRRCSIESCCISEIALEKSSRVGIASNQMLDVLFNLLWLGTFIYKIKMLDFIYQVLSNYGIFYNFIWLCMSGDMHTLSSNGNKDILLKNIFCKYILLNIAYKIVFSMIFQHDGLTFMFL